MTSGDNLPADLAEALRARLTGNAAAAAPPRRRDEGPGRSLSGAQRRIWFVDRLAGPAPLHTVSVAMRLCGPLDHAALRHAVRAILVRHEVLRSVVVDNGAAPEARELPAVEVPVERTVCPRGSDPAKMLTGITDRPFDLTTEPPLRVHLLATAPDDHILLLLVHHLACDARSLELLVTDLDRAYRGQRLPPLMIQYADVAERQERRAASSLGRTVAYWRDRLAGAPAVLNLACARPRPAHRTYRGLVQTLALPGDLVDAAGRLGVRHGGSLSTVLLAAWYSVLRRHSGQDDIVVGTAVTGRDW